MAKRKHSPTSKAARDIRLADGWRDVSGYVGRFMINESGDVLSLPRKVHRRNNSTHTTREIIKKQRVTQFGYATILLSINKKYSHKLIHRLVADVFLPPPPSKKHNINHIDGNKLNNHYSNLEWTTPSENLRHAYRIGLMSQKGEKHASHKLTNKLVMKIFNSNLPHNELAKKFGISTSNVQSIKSGNTWSHITNKTYSRKNLNKEDVVNIFTSHEHWKSVSKKYNIKESAIRAIRKGRSWRNITSSLKLSS